MGEDITIWNYHEALTLGLVLLLEMWTLFFNEILDFRLKFEFELIITRLRSELFSTNFNPKKQLNERNRKENPQIKPAK